MPIVNRLLEDLPRDVRDGFLGECEPVSLAFGTVLCERGRPYRHVYFPLGGFLSLVATVSRHPPLEIALIGSEGMLGATLVLGVKTARLQGIVQGREPPGASLPRGSGAHCAKVPRCAVSLADTSTSC